MRLAVVALLLGAMVAGCAEEAPLPEEVEEDDCIEGFCGQEPVDEGERDLRIDLIASDSLPAPQWQVGDVFEQHMYFGKDDRTGRHIQTMVLSTSGGYEIATSDPEAARFEAVYDYPILGRIGKDLETAAFGSDWSWMYDFPLEDGKTWTGEVEDLVNWNTYNFHDLELEMRARYDAAIDTPHGDFPGFWIEAYTSQGDRLALYNYVPAVGWFSHMWIYDIEAGDDTIMFHAMSMGTWKGYQGVYYVAEATSLVEDFFGFFPDPDNPTRPPVYGDPAPIEFSFPSDQEAIMGIAVPIAFPGRTEIRLLAPDGSEDIYYHQQTDLDDRGFSVYFIDDPPQEGKWQARFVTSGAFMGYYLFLSAVDVQRYDMA